MKIPKIFINYFILLLFFLYGINNFIFERIFYFNEILSFIGICYFIYYVVPQLSKGLIRIPKSKIFRLVLALLILGVLHLLFSLTRKTNFYFYLRNSVIVYSMSTFFIGFYTLPYLLKFVKTFRTTLFLYLSFALISPSIALLERFMGAVFFPFLFKRLNILTLLAILTLDIILARRYESSTVILVTLILFGLVMIPNYFSFKIIATSTAIGLLSFFILFAPNFKLYKTPPYTLFGNIEAVAHSHKILNLDGNSTWRAVFWYRLVTERFPENIVGIGLGTPLLPYKKGANTVESEHDDEHDIHVSGCHNTYLTLSIRLGLPFLVIIFLIFSIVNKEFYKNRKYYFQNGYVIIFISFFTVSIIGLFNLVLESPTGASLFWGLLGFTAASIHQRKTENNATTLTKKTSKTTTL